MNYKPHFVKTDRPFVFHNVNIIPMTGEKILPAMSVVIKKRKIYSIEKAPVLKKDSPAGQIKLYPVRKVKKRCYVVDCAGQYLMPGLTDMHVHLVQNREDLFLYLAAGVTAIRNMAGLCLPGIFRLHPDLQITNHPVLKKAIDGNIIPGPDLYTTGPMLDGKPVTWPWPLAYTVTKKGKVRRLVKLHKQLGYDFVKVYRRLNTEIFDKIMEEAGKAGLKVCGHVPRAAGIEHAVRAGIHSIEHLVGYFDFMRPEKTIKPAEYRKFAGLTAEKGAWNCPTLIIWNNARPVEQRAQLEKKEFNSYIPRVLRQKAYTSQQKLAAHVKKNREFEYPASRLEDCYRLTGELFRAGAGIVAGTDTSTPFTVAGFSLHDELEHLARAGLPTNEVLKAATSNAARCLGVFHREGSVEEGKKANLLLLNKNPMENVSNTRKIAGVMKQGAWLPAKEIQKGLELLEKRYI